MHGYESHTLPIAKWLSVTARSTAGGTFRLPELELHGSMHGGTSLGSWSREKPIKNIEINPYRVKEH